MYKKEFVIKAQLFLSAEARLQGPDSGADYAYAEYNAEALDVRSALNLAAAFFDNLVGADRWECTRVTAWDVIYAEG